MNKYLEKIAETTDDKVLRFGGSGIGLGVGHHLISKPLSRGDITGRATYYHGTTKDIASKIKRQGIIPRATRGAIDEVAGSDSLFAKENKNLAFVTRSKSMAHQYSHQAESIKNGRFTEFRESPGKVIKDSLTSRFKDSFGIKKDPGLIKVNIPTWRENVKKKIVRNPELDSIAVMFNPALKHELEHNTLTHKGRINSRYIKGGRGYKGNSAGEILKYIKANPKRFSQGLGKAGLGAAIVSGSAYAMTHKPKE